MNELKYLFLAWTLFSRVHAGNFYKSTSETTRTDRALDDYDDNVQEDGSSGSLYGKIEDGYLGKGLNSTKLTKPCYPRWARHPGISLRANWGTSQMSSVFSSPAGIGSIEFRTRKAVKSVEECARRCLLGTKCDMFTTLSSDRWVECIYYPHLKLKHLPLYQVTNPDVSKITFVLECDDSWATIDATKNWENSDLKGLEETSSCSSPENYNGSTHDRYFHQMLPACPKGWIDYKNKKCLLHSDVEKLNYWNAHAKCIGNDARLISNLDTELLKFGQNQSWNDEYWTSSYRTSYNPTAFFWDYGWYRQPLGDISNWDLEATNDESKKEDCIRVDGTIMKDIYCHKTVNYVCEKERNLKGLGGQVEGNSVERIVYCSDLKIQYDLKYDLNLEAIIPHLPEEYIMKFNPTSYLKTWIRSMPGNPKKFGEFRVSAEVGEDIVVQKTLPMTEKSESIPLIIPIENISELPKYISIKASTTEGGLISFSPIDIKVDQPIYLGCLKFTTSNSDLNVIDSHFKCLIHCKSVRTRFSLFSPGACACKNETEINQLFGSDSSQAEDVECQSLFSNSVFSVYVAECEEEFVRLGSRCYKSVEKGPPVLLEERCNQISSHLWAPRALAEVESILNLFQSVDMYHLGVRRKDIREGIIFNDLTIEPGFYPFYYSSGEHDGFKLDPDPIANDNYFGSGKVLTIDGDGTVKVATDKQDGFGVCQKDLVQPLGLYWLIDEVELQYKIHNEGMDFLEIDSSILPDFPGIPLRIQLTRGTGASWIEIELAKRVMVDSLLITTSPKNWIKELTVNITEEDVTVPKIKVFYSSPDTLTEPYQRILRFPQPYVFERIKIHILNSSATIEMKIEFLGQFISKMIPEGFLDHGPYVISEKRLSETEEIDEDVKYSICPQGGMRFKCNSEVAPACKTTAGKLCIFPFKYQGNSFNTCPLFNGRPWCATTIDDTGKYDDAMKTWGYCNQTCAQVCKTTVGDYCIFPFIYKNVTYNTCVSDSNGYWCSTKVDSNGLHALGDNWGFCEQKCTQGPSCGVELFNEQIKVGSIAFSHGVEPGRTVNSIMASNTLIGATSKVKEDTSDNIGKDIYIYCEHEGSNLQVYVNNKLQLIDIEFDKSITHVKLNGPISPGKFEKALRNQSALLPPTTPNTLGCDITGNMCSKVLNDEGKIIQVYETVPSKEVDYMELEIVWNCHRAPNFHSLCNMLEWKWKKDMVSGRKDELICPGEEGNIKLGLQCLRLKHIPKSFSEAQQSCSEDTSGFINPPQGAIQSEILRLFAEKNELSSFWLGVIKVDGKWTKITWDPIHLDDLNIVNTEAIGNCMIADSENQFKPKIVDCGEKHGYYCNASPSCPAGFKWVPSLGQTCLGSGVGANDLIKDYHSGLSFCAKFGLSLYTPSTSNELEDFLKWRDLNKPISKNDFMIGLRRYWSDEKAFFVSHYSLGDLPDSTFPSLKGKGNCFSASFEKLNNDSCYEEREIRPMRAVCQYKECTTLEKKICIFPFRYKGRTYDTCIYSDQGKPWCSLQVDVNRNHIIGVDTVGTCEESCAVQSCPTGFFRIDKNCFHLSARTNNGIVGSTEEAQRKCLEMGARLYQPRDFKSFAELIDRESIFLKNSSFHFLQYQSTESFIAIGAKVESIGPTISIKYLDGTKAYLIEQLLEIDEKVAWPMPYNNEACIMLNKDGNMTVEDCFGYGLHSKKLLGYICEAKEFLTVDGPESNTTCLFPFQTKTAGPLHNTCVFDDLHKGPWCATEVDEKGVVISEKWGICRDERLIAIDGVGAGKECILPFILDNVWQTTCIYNPKGELWCPTNIHDGSRVLNDATYEVGSCPDFLKPVNSDCNMNYDLVDQVCLRVSPIPEDFDKAQIKCREEGGNLLSILTDSLLKSLEIFILKLNSSELYLSQSLNITSLTKFWIGGMFKEDNWYWMSNGKKVNNSLPKITCGIEECTKSSGLVFKLDANTLEGIQISEKMPYICQSSCPVGFKWQKKIQKCLMIVDTPNSKTKSAATLDCAKRKSNLLSIDSCDDLLKLSEDIIINGQTTFWLGFYSVNKLTNTQRRSNQVYGINSKGYSWINDDSCIKTAEGNRVSTFLKANDSDFTAYLNLSKISNPQINLHALHQHDTIKRGYICEAEKDWMCLNDHVMYQENCYHYVNMSTSFTNAFLHCNSMHGTLVEPKLFSQILFLQSYLSELDMKVTIWTGYRRNMLKDEKRGAKYFETSTFKKSDFAQDLQASGDGDCLGMNITDLNWIWMNCSEKIAVVCQTPQIPTAEAVELIHDPLLVLPMDDTPNDITYQSWISNPNEKVIQTKMPQPSDFLGHMLSYIDVTKTFSFKEGITIALWLRSIQTSRKAVILDFQEEKDTQGLVFYIDNKKLNIDLCNNKECTTFTSAYLLPEKSWTFASVSFDSLNKMGTFYVNETFGFEEFKSSYFHYDTEDWLFIDSTSLEKPRLGSAKFQEEDREENFYGQMSCLKVFSQYLSVAQMYHVMKNCKIDDSYSKVYECPEGFFLLHSQCYKLHTEQMTYVSAELTCLTAFDFESYLAFPDDYFSHEYLLQILVEQGLEDIWLGLDSMSVHPPGERWIKSEGNEEENLTWSDGFPVSGVQYCAFSNTTIIMGNEDCKQKKPFFCSVRQETILKCPPNYFSYKEMCIYKNSNKTSFLESKEQCGHYGGIVLPIQTKGLFEFIKHHAAFQNSSNLYIGMYRTNGLTRFTDFSEYNSSSYDFNGSNLVREDLPCVFLDNEDGFKAKQTECEHQFESYCLWKEPSCPENYTVNLAEPNGRTCYLLTQEMSNYEDGECKSGNHFLDRIAQPEDLKLVKLALQYKKFAWINQSTENSKEECSVATSTGLNLTLNGSRCEEELPTLCEYIACYSTDGFQCIFPFIYKGEEYKQCIYGDVFKPWCPIEIDKNSQIKRWGLCLNHCPTEEEKPMCLTPPPIPEFGLYSDNTTSNFESNWFHINFSTDDKSSYIISGEKQRLHWPDWIYDSDNITDKIMFTVANNFEDFSMIYSAFANNTHAQYTCPKGFVFETTYNRSITVLCSNWKWHNEEFDASQQCIALRCNEDELPEKTADMNIASDDHFRRKSNDSKNWNTYNNIVKYSCPEGHVVKWPNIDASANAIDFEVICHEDAKWHPVTDEKPISQLPSCIPRNCTSPPTTVDMTDFGMMSWIETPGNARPYGTIVRYWCPQINWGYPSSGLDQMWSMCGKDGHWNVTEVENCIELPCPNQPPPPHLGAERVYGLNATRYTCPDGKMFETGDYPFWYNKCLPNKQWSHPQKLPNCMPQQCLETPPAPNPTNEIKWPNKQNKLGDTVTYSCVHGRYIVATDNNGWENIVAEQTVQCMEVNGLMVWMPQNISECSVPDEVETTTIVLPTNPPYEVRFPETTDYYWSLFTKNVTEKIGGEPQESQGPFGFGNGVQLDQSESQCVVDDDFQDEGDECAVNPVNCADGISYSMFYKNTFSINPSDLETGDPTQFDRKYILSTGGAKDTPGVGIFLSGPFLGAELSTGLETWSIIIRGILPKNNTWNNIAVRWKQPVTDQTEFNTFKDNNQMDMIGGLEIFLNLEKVGHAIWSAEAEAAALAGEDPPKVNENAKEPLPKPTLILGCHKTSDDTAYRNFAGGVFDEVAIWRRHVMDNETGIFYGGYKESFTGISSEELVNMMNGVDLADPAQAAVAVDVLNAVVGGGAKTTPFRNIFPTQPTTTTTANPNQPAATVNPNPVVTTVRTTTTSTPPPVTEKGKSEKDLINFKNILMKLTAEAGVAHNLTESQFKKNMGRVGLVGNFFKSANQPGWEEVSQIASEGGSHELRMNLERFQMRALQRLVINETTGIFALELHEQNSFHQMFKISAAALSTYFPETLVPITFPRPSNVRIKREVDSAFVVDNVLDQWTQILESIDIPRVMFSGSCADKDVSYIFNIIDDFPDPGWKNPVSIKSKNIQLDSKVIHVSATANKYDSGTHTFSEDCQPDSKLLYSHKVVARLYTKTQMPSKRQLLFHEDEVYTTILRRYCAIWNPMIGPFGAWDIDDVTTVSVNNEMGTCMSEKLGAFAIIAELVDQPYAKEELTWLSIVKILGYVLSIICLVIFIAFIQLSSYLWEQFNIINMNLSIFMILGHVCMLLTDIEAIQVDRHLCTAIGCMIQLAYTSTALILTAECHACFKAITAGMIGGRAVMYVLTAVGVSFIVLGYDIFMNLQDMGTDPMCMVGWDNFVKWHLFSPIITAAGVGIF